MTVKSKENKTETPLDRAKRISSYVEELISTIGEHPECELKETWRRDNSPLKAEFVKDIRSNANSTIPIEKEKYVVVGASETERKIVGCDHSEFDDADIRQLLQSNLDSVTDFEVFRLKSSEDLDFVVFVIPHQTKRRCHSIN